MKTRADVEAEGYQIDARGMVTSLGKFQGEAWWAPIVYGWMMDGDGEELDGLMDDESALLFTLTDEDRAAFDLPEPVTGILLEETSDGFVYCCPMMAG